MIRTSRLLLPLLLAAASLQVACKSRPSGIADYTAVPDSPPRAVVRDGVAITLRDQKLTVFRDGRRVRDYDISTSKFGIGAAPGSRRTPTGIHAVSDMVGGNQPRGMVFKGCRPTGEVVGVDAPGRDPIVTRIIQLHGLEDGNRNSHSRRIYIHGTPEERNIGRPASYGCIRMRSADVMDLYPLVYRGMPVAIERCSQSMYMRAVQQASTPRIRIPDSVVASLPKDQVSPRRRSYRARRHAVRGSRRAIASRGRSASTRRSSSGRRLARRTTRRRR